MDSNYDVNNVLDPNEEVERFVEECYAGYSNVEQVGVWTVYQAPNGDVVLTLTGGLILYHRPGERPVSLFAHDYSPGRRTRDNTGVLEPWFVGRCTACTALDYVISTRSRRRLCLECYEASSDMPVWDGSIR